MKKIFNFLCVCVCFSFFASCETYKVADPDMTAVCDVDGSYLTFAYEANATEPVALFHIEITNTTLNESDKIWMTLTDCLPIAVGKYKYMNAMRFLLNYDASSNSFTCTEVSCNQPYTAYSWYYEQHYYTYGGKVKNSTYIVSVSGKVTKDGINTKSGYKTDGIEFTLSVREPGVNDSASSYTVKGMRNTGWAADLVEYQDYIDKNY